MEDGHEFSAATALAKSKRGGGTAAVHSADALNYTLTMGSVMKLIEAETGEGNRSVQYTIPWYVLDGVSADRPLLVRQVQKQLRKLGFMVRREEFTLFIDWDLDLYHREEELRREHAQQARRDEDARRRQIPAPDRDAPLPEREPIKRVVRQFPRATGARGAQANARAAKPKPKPKPVEAPMGRGGRPRPSMDEIRRLVSAPPKKKAKAAAKK